MFKLFTWWNSVSPGGWFDIKRRSDLIGTDEYGNRYFQDRKTSVEGRKRRYVIYDGLAEPSKVPPEWHGWLHYTVDETPEEAGFERKDWHQPHRANQTGTPNAHRPAGQEDAASHRAGYGSWSPE